MGLLDTGVRQEALGTKKEPADVHYNGEKDERCLFFVLRNEEQCQTP